MALKCWGKARNQGHSPVALVRIHRQGRALPHIRAAKPVRMTPRVFLFLDSVFTFKTVPHQGGEAGAKDDQGFCLLIDVQTLSTYEVRVPLSLSSCLSINST